jgi:hypothetical protein
MPLYVYLKTTQSYRQGDEAEYNEGDANAQSLLDRGIIAAIKDTPPVETKVTPPKKERKAKADQ